MKDDEIIATEKEIDELCEVWRKRDPHPELSLRYFGWDISERELARRVIVKQKKELIEKHKRIRELIDMLTPCMGAMREAAVFAERVFIEAEDFDAKSAELLAMVLSGEVWPSDVRAWDFSPKLAEFLQKQAQNNIDYYAFFSKSDK